MPEWSNGAVSKTVDQLAGPRVRIPVSPPETMPQHFFAAASLFSTDVDKKNLIELDKNTIFEFNSEVKGDYLTITLSEVDAIAPFVYTVDLTFKDIIEVDIMFKSCDSLKIVKEHIDRLFQDGKVKITDHIGTIVIDEELLSPVIVPL